MLLMLMDDKISSEKFPIALKMFLILAADEQMFHRLSKEQLGNMTIEEAKFAVSIYTEKALYYLRELTLWQIFEPYTNSSVDRSQA